VLLDPVLFSRRMIGAMGIAARLGLHRRHALARKAATRRTHWPDREAALASLQGRGIFKGWADAALRAYIDHALGDCGEGVVLKCRPSREVDIFSSFPTRMWAQLAAIQVPTLVLYGEHTYPFVPRSVQRLARINPRVSAREVAGGHCFMQEDPAMAAEQVLAFLQG
jgi:pimeloyl-ACP methyl ester carboxylesterase